MLKWKKASDGDGIEVESGAYYAMVINLGSPSPNHPGFRWAVTLNGKKIDGGMAHSQRSAKAAAEAAMNKVR